GGGFVVVWRRWGGGTRDLPSQTPLAGARKCCPAIMLGAPTMTGLPVAISIASRRLMPSSRRACDLESGCHSTMGLVSPFLMMSSPSACNSSGDMRGKSSAAGWMGGIDRHELLAGVPFALLLDIVMSP